MTFSRAALAVLLCGCTHAPSTVTVTASLPKAVQVVAPAEPEETFGCAVYAKDGISENAEIFRTCLEREVAAEESSCEGGGSPDLATLELAVLLIDGAGGPSDVPRAKNLLAGCFRDVAVEKVLAHASDKTKNPHARSLEGCDSFAETTFAANECLGEHIENERAWLRRERRSYDAKVRPLFEAAMAAATTWQTKLGEIEYARYGTGTMRGPAMESRILASMKSRRDRLAAIRDWKPSVVSAKERAANSEELVRAHGVIHDDDDEPEVPRALDAEEKAWVTYRDAEVALYGALHPGTRDGATWVLEKEHTDALTDVSPEP